MSIGFEPETSLESDLEALSQTRQLIDPNWSQDRGISQTFAEHR